MRIALLNSDTKQEVEAECFESVTFILHESFGDRAKKGTNIHGGAWAEKFLVAQMGSDG